MVVHAEFFDSSAYEATNCKTWPWLDVLKSFLKIEKPPSPIWPEKISLFYCKRRGNFAPNSKKNKPVISTPGRGKEDSQARDGLRTKRQLGAGSKWSTGHPWPGSKWSTGHPWPGSKWSTGHPWPASDRFCEILRGCRRCRRARRRRWVRSCPHPRGIYCG